MKNKKFTKKNNLIRNFSRENVEKVTKLNRNDIIEKKVEEVEKRVQYIGKIDKEKLGRYKDKIVTEDVIISEERIKHVKEHHPGDFEKYGKYVGTIIEEPDYILVDSKNVDTLLYMKKLTEERKECTSCTKIKHYKE